MQTQIKLYHVTRESEISNRVVRELNAAVCTITFKHARGTQLADLYRCPNSADCLVAHGTCAPVNSTYAGTVAITFDLPINSLL